MRVCRLVSAKLTARNRLCAFWQSEYSNICCERVLTARTVHTQDLHTLWCSLFRSASGLLSAGIFPVDRPNDCTECACCLLIYRPDLNARRFRSLSYCHFKLLPAFYGLRSAETAWKSLCAALMLPFLAVHSFYVACFLVDTLLCCTVWLPILRMKFITAAFYLTWGIFNESCCLDCIISNGLASFSNAKLAFLLLQKCWFVGANFRFIDCVFALYMRIFRKFAALQWERRSNSGSSA